MSRLCSVQNQNGSRGTWPKFASQGKTRQPSFYYLIIWVQGVVSNATQYLLKRTNSCSLHNFIRVHFVRRINLESVTIYLIRSQVYIELFASVENRLLAHQIRISRNLSRFSWSFCTPVFAMGPKTLTPESDCWKSSKSSISIQDFSEQTNKNQKIQYVHRTSYYMHWKRFDFPKSQSLI